MSAGLKAAGPIDRHFAYRNVSFDFILLLEDRKTVSATVLPTRTVVVKAPLEATDNRIHDFLRRKLRWILKQRRYFAQFKAHPEKRYVSGETFRYRGRSHKLIIRKDSRHERVSLQHGRLVIYTVAPKSRAHVKGLLDSWYSARAHKVFAERLSACFTLFDHDEEPDLQVRPMTRRWGSYSHQTHRVILNRKLIEAATRHIDYVLIHELCHVKHRPHNRAFYDLLASKLPRWDKLKIELEISLLG